MKVIVFLVIAIFLTIIMSFLSAPIKSEVREWRNFFLKPALVAFCVILVISGFIYASIRSEQKQIQKEHDQYISEQEQNQKEQEQAQKKRDQYISELNKDPNTNKDPQNLDFDGNGIISEDECMSVPGYRYEPDKKCYRSGYGL